MTEAIGMRARRPGRGFTVDHLVVTDELLDQLGEAFIAGRIRETTNCTFELYLLNPGAWERIAAAVREGHAVRNQGAWELVASILLRPESGMMVQ